MPGKRAGLWAFTGVLLFLAGCHTIPLRNEPLARFDKDAGYRYQNTPCGKGNSDSLLVVLTFSGGGTRAAALSYGVLEKLRDTTIVWEGQERTLLDEVDVISSVSGGSLPAAYYGLFGDEIFEDFPDKVLYHSIQDGLIRRVLSPFNWPKLASPFYGRTDMLADDFSRRIFKEKTFADLQAKSERPFIVLNATDTELGTRFDFTQRQFDLLYSDLSAYPVGHAVAASAAFPGLLTPVTLRNYPKGDDFVKPAWIGEELARERAGHPRHRAALQAESYLGEDRPWVYLCDGGVSDNLGLLPVLQLLHGTFPGDNFQASLKNEAVRKMVVITVNAKREKKPPLDPKGKVLGLFQVLGVATSAPLSNLTDSELVIMRSYVRQQEERQRFKRRLTELYGAEAVAKNFPELAGPDVDHHFIEVDFDRVGDEAERESLNDIPTAFKLKREQVDALRKAAGEILDAHPEFQECLVETR